MGGMGEHIDGLNSQYFVLRIEVLQVACLGGWIATDIHDALGSCTEDGLYHIGVHTCTRRIGDDDIGTSVLGNELIGEDVLHVAGIEEGIVDVVDLGIDLGILDGLGDILDTNDLTGLTSHEVGNGTCTGVEVVN